MTQPELTFEPDAAWRVAVPEGVSGDCAVQRFEVSLAEAQWTLARVRSPANRRTTSRPASTPGSWLTTR